MTKFTDLRAVFVLLFRLYWTTRKKGAAAIDLTASHNADVVLCCVVRDSRPCEILLSRQKGNFYR